MDFQLGFRSRQTNSANQHDRHDFVDYNPITWDINLPGLPFDPQTLPRKIVEVCKNILDFKA